MYVHYSANTTQHSMHSRILMTIHYKYATRREQNHKTPGKKHKTQNTTHCGTVVWWGGSGEGWWYGERQKLLDRNLRREAVNSDLSYNGSTTVLCTNNVT